MLNKTPMKGSGNMIIKEVEDRQRLVKRINAEMEAVINSPSTDVERFRMGILRGLMGELKILNDRIHRKSRRFAKVS